MKIELELEHGEVKWIRDTFRHLSKEASAREISTGGAVWESKFWDRLGEILDKQMAPPSVPFGPKIPWQPGGVSTLGYHPGGALPSREVPLD